jgi:quinoprotein glucose dehydrogenase
MTPPWSTITAYDLNEGKIMWQTPYGDLPQAGPSESFEEMSFRRADSWFSPPDWWCPWIIRRSSTQSTSEVVFTRDVPNGAVGVLAVDEVNDREYILFALTAGPAFPKGARMAVGGFSPVPRPKSYVAFALSLSPTRRK